MSTDFLHQAGLLSSDNKIRIFPNLSNIDMHKCILMHTVHILQLPEFLESPGGYGYNGVMTPDLITDKLSMQIQKDVGTRMLISAYMRSTNAAFQI